MPEKSCSSCGKPFGCASGAGCWCFGITICETRLENLRATFGDCLCRECLLLHPAGTPANSRERL